MGKTVDIKPTPQFYESLKAIMPAVKKVILEEEGAVISANFSTFTKREALCDKQFWHMLIMVTLSISYGFFTKVAFKSYGMLKLNDDQLLTTVSLFGFITAASSRFIWPFVQSYIG